MRPSRRCPLFLPLSSLALAILAVASSAAAQDRSFAPLVVRVEGSTRALSLGGASVASDEDEAIFTNPAQFLVSRGVAASGGYFAGGARHLTLASAQKSGNTGVGIGVRYLDFTNTDGQLPADARSLGDVATDWRATSLAVSAGAARELFGVRLGAALTLSQDQVGAVRDRRTSLDLGASREISMVSAGIAVRNLDVGAASVADAKLPLTVIAGVNGEGLPVGPFDLGGGAALAVRRDGRVMPRLGLELAYEWIAGYSVSLRAGARRPEIDGQSPATVGAGFRRDNLSLDYAYERFGARGGAHRVGIRLR